MNIFFLDKTPEQSAHYLCDKHVVKMALETAQMLCTAYQQKYGIKEDLYKPAYSNHPMTKWVGNTGGNFFFTMRLFDCITDEYATRYLKWHKSRKTILLLHRKYKEWRDWKTPFTTPPQCMPDKYKLRSDLYVEAYRRYYRGEKNYFAKWDKVRNTPDWWIK